MVLEEHAMIATLRPLTYDDLRDMPDDGQRYEIIDGELIVTPAPTMGHQRVVGRLYRLLDDYARQVQGGEVAFAPFDVRLGQFDAVEPDLVFLSATRPRVPNDENSIDFAPDLVVEVISPSSRRVDRVRKMALYARSGVPEYWIGDPMDRTLVANLLKGKEYVPVDHDTDGRIPSPTLSGLRVDPAEVFSGLD
jgi:Uma2 family endonuclease